MNKIINFGEAVEGYNIPVLNEREIRAAAGILFLVMFISVLTVLLKGDFLLLKYAVVIFLTDILIRVLVNPRFSPLLILGRLIVRNQVPEYVGAAQKKFAWVIGAILALIIFIHLILLNAFSPITGIICFICLTFLYFESVFGICLGCKFYPMLHKGKVQYCSGEVCDSKLKQDIQRISHPQVITIFVYALFIIFSIYLLKDNFTKKPHRLFETEISGHVNEK